MRNIKINEQFKIDDSHSNIRGIISMKKANTGEIIFTRENMIVKTGRAAIMNALVTDSSVPTFKFFISKTSDITVPEMTYQPSSTAREDTIVDGVLKLNSNYRVFDATKKPSLTDKTNASIKKLTEGTGIAEYLVDSDGLYLHFHAFIKGKDTDLSDNFLSAGLIVDSKLFSRVTFPATPIVTGTLYEIDYYVYF